MIKNVDNNGNVHNVTSIRRPLKWKRFEYLLSNGNLYIDTGVIVNDSISLIGSTIDFLVTYNPSQTTIGGAVLTTGSNRYTNAQIFIYQNSFYDLGGFTFSQNDILSRTVATYVGNVQGNPNLSFLLFARNLNDFTPPVQIQGKLKIFSAKFYNNGVLVRDFVPAEYNGLYGLWDLVQDKFYGNLGTGSFTVGPEIKNYEEVEEVRKVGRLLPAGLELYDYILSSGTQYINTEYAPNSLTTFTVDMAILNGGDRLNGCIQSAGSRFHLGILNEYFLGGVGSNYGNYGAKDTNRHVFSISGDGTVKIDNNTYTSGTIDTLTIPLFIFARNSLGTASCFITGKCYSSLIYENSQLVKNLLPCAYYGEPGMWDTVRNKFYRNSGGGSFTLGNKITLELYEYLKLEGNYLDTGFIPDLNTRVQAELLLYNQSTTALFGSRSNTNDLAFTVWNGAQEKLSFLYGNTGYTGGIFNPTPAVNTKFIIDLNKNIGTLNNGATVVYNLSTFSSNCSFLIGTTNSNGIVDGRYTKENVYWFKIWSNDNLVRDYIPCTYNGSSGLWDKLNWKFYGNSGSGSLVVANKISSSKIYYKKIRPFTIESTEDSNSITLTYINELEDKTGYPTQIEADVWVDGATQPTLVIIPINTETTIANLDNGHKARVFIHNHNLLNHPKENTFIKFGSSKEFKAYGNLTSLLEDNMPDIRWKGLFSDSRVLDLHNLILPDLVNLYDYSNFCKNCTHLIDASFKLPTITNNAVGAFTSMFYGCESLTKSPGKIHLYRVSTNRYEISDSMCSEMFNGCAMLINAPEIQADWVGSGSCDSMFYNCTSLVTMPKLDIMLLGGILCYKNMFYGCTGLVNVYKLPATTLNYNCYQYMFLGCSSLRTTPKDMLPAMTVNNYGYYGMFKECTNLVDIPNLPATVLGTHCYREMFYGCTSLSYVPANLLPATTASYYGYYEMFKGCTSLTSPPNLPATSINAYCYDSMFYDCTSITTPPALLAITLKDLCYRHMFHNCTSLLTTPTLPATSLANLCYAYMFVNCTSLTTAPELSATTLYPSCYYLMFSGCTNLRTIPARLPAMTLKNSSYYGMFLNCTSITETPELPATTLDQSCYRTMFYGCTSLTNAPDLPVTTLSYACYNMMFGGCTSLTTAPELPATTLAGYCYFEMFRGCTSLTTAPHILPAISLSTNCYNAMFKGTAIVIAPVLPAITLATSCYQDMFRDCKSIRWIKALFTTTPSNSYTSNWLTAARNNVDCTFVKNENAAWTTTGNNAVLSKWVVQTCEEDDYSYPNNL